MRKKELYGSTKDIDILNYQVLKRRSKRTGETVCLCNMEKDSNAVLVALLSGEGHIIESQVFIWTDSTKKQIMSHARKAYNSLIDIYFYGSD